MTFGKGDRVLVRSGRVYSPPKPRRAADLDEYGEEKPEPRHGTPGIVLEVSKGRARVMYLRKGSTALSPRAKFTREAIWVDLSQLESRRPIENEDDYLITDRETAPLDEEIVDEEEWEDLDADRGDD